MNNAPIFSGTLETRGYWQQIVKKNKHKIIWKKGTEVVRIGQLTIILYKSTII